MIKYQKGYIFNGHTFVVNKEDVHNATDDMFVEATALLPVSDVAPVRHGRWVEYENESDMGYHYCSECKHQAFNYDEGGCNVEILSDYCPHCGARMDGGDEDGNEAYRG